jgi:hypothetical protein
MDGNDQPNEADTNNSEPNGGVSSAPKRESLTEFLQRSELRFLNIEARDHRRHETE